MTAERFEDRLLTQLRDVVAANPAPDPVAARLRERTPRARLALAGAATAAAATVAVVVSGGGSVAAPAYAVTRASDGMVSVEIRSLSDAAGLERALRAQGVPAEVDYDATPACATPAPPPAGAGPGHGEFRTEEKVDGGGPSTSRAGTPPAGGAPERHATRGAIRVREDGSATFSIDPGDLPAGEKIWITTAGAERAPSAVSVGIGTTRPAAMPCPGG